MYPNIIFFLIDGIRADQCYGKDRSSKRDFVVGESSEIINVRGKLMENNEI